MASSTVSLTVKKKSSYKIRPPKASTTLTSINPHMFAVSPRAGGYIKVLPSRSEVSSIMQTCKSLAKEKSQASMSVFYSSSRDRRINFALQDSDWDLGVSDIDIGGTGTLADNMLAVTISCVMLMATKVHKISDEYFRYAENYLSCIKDDMDFHPPNIQGILNHIAYLRSKKKKKKRKKDRKKVDSCECLNREESESSVGTSSSKKSLKKKSSTKVKVKQTPSNKGKSNIPVRKKSFA